MSNRRDVVLGLGAGLAAIVGTAGSGLAALGTRHHELLRRDEAAADVSVDVAESGGPRGAFPPTAPLRCTAGTVTMPQQEGPFYTPKSPQRRDIRDFGVAAQPLVVRGRVLDARCQPLAGAILDFWQTGHDGVYDQHGYRYRGYQYTDSAGRFELVTVRPHAYTAMRTFRTPHIHVKVQGRNTPLLTTQLYVPDAQETNARDFLYDPSLELAYAAGDGPAQHGFFDFVLGESRT